MSAQICVVLQDFRSFGGWSINLIDRFCCHVVSWRSGICEAPEPGVWNVGRLLEDKTMHLQVTIRGNHPYSWTPKPLSLLSRTLSRLSFQLPSFKLTVSVKSSFGTSLFLLKQQCQHHTPFNTWFNNSVLDIPS